MIVKASDGYTIVYGLAELDPGTRPNRIILADKAEGAPLAAKDGPFKVVAEGDLRPSRGARLVTSIDVRDLGGDRAARARPEGAFDLRRRRSRPAWLHPTPAPAYKHRTDLAELTRD